MNLIHPFLTLLIALNSASAAATATATTKVALATPAITAFVTRATYTTVTAATFAAHAPCATPFVYPVSADTDLGYEQVPSAAETIKYYLMSFWGRLSEPILEFKEKLQHGFEELVARKPPADQGLFTFQELYERALAEGRLKYTGRLSDNDTSSILQELYDRAIPEKKPKEDRLPGDKSTFTLQELYERILAEKKLKADAAAIELQLKETEDSGTFYPPVTDIPSAADLPPVSSNDTDDHSYVEHYPLYVVLSSLALVVLALYKELTYTGVQLLIFLWEQLFADTVQLMFRRMIERLQSVSSGCFYNLKLSLSTWALSISDKFAFTKDMMCRLLNTIKAAAARVSTKVLDTMVSRMLNWFNIDLAPLRATVQLLFGGQVNATKLITATSPSVVDKLLTYMENHPPSAKSRPKAPFEAGPPEPHNQPTRVGLPQSDSEVTSNDEPILHSSMPLPMPKPIDEQLLTEPPVGDTAGAEQDSQLPAPMANTEKAVYKCDIDEASKTLTAIATFPVDAPELSNSFLARVDYIRAHQSMIELQADGIVYVKEMKRLFNQGVEKLIAETDSLTIEGLSGLGGYLETLEAAYVKGLDTERLTKNIEFIDERYREGKLVRFKHGKKVKKTVKLLKANLAKRQQCTEEFLQEVRWLCETYNENLERITGTSNAHGSL